MRSRSPYTWAAVAVLAFPLLVEAGRLVTNEPWSGFVPWNSHLVSTLLVGVLVATIVVLVRGPRAAVAERMLAVVTPLALSGHALVVTTAKNRIGFLYVIVAMLFAFLAQRAFRAEGRESAHPPTTEVVRGRMV